ncbi:MAG: PepSY-like domain-containing protein [Bacteroidia bacterium]
MKTNSFIILLLMFVTVIAFAQVPQNIKEVFDSKYPDGQIKKFKQIDGYYKVVFMYRGEKDLATFSEKGNWIQTVANKKQKDVPLAVKMALKGSKYQGWYIQGCKQIETPGGIIYSFDVTSPYTFTGSFKTDYYVYLTPSGKIVK